MSDDDRETRYEGTDETTAEPRRRTPANDGFEEWPPDLDASSSAEDESRFRQALDDAGVDPAELDNREAERLFAVFDVLDVEVGGQVNQRSPLDPLGIGVGFDEIPEIGRLVLGAMRQGAAYSMRSQFRVAKKTAVAATTVDSSEAFIGELVSITENEFARLGVEISNYQASNGRPSATVSTASDMSDEDSLRERGERILQQSADFEHDEAVHPAYDRIIEQLASDEARILRLFATEGPQPSVDIHDAGYLPLGSTTVAAGLSMVGIEAGCRHEERTSQYLSNLQRLGLVRFADEPVEDFTRYQVLEAQPDATTAMNEARRPKPDRRSIHLTPFGVDFCETCLPTVVDDGVAGALESPHEE